MPLISNQDFYQTITTTGKIPAFYSKLEYLPKSPYILYENENNAIESNCPIVSFNLFPDYLAPKYSEKLWKVCTLPQKKIEGFSIVIKEQLDIETFMKNEYSKSFRQNIRRFITRFESCFNVSYKMFHGEISKVVYQELMARLYDMLTVRFDQRNDENKILQKWNYYLKTTYELVNSGKASLFVIYNGNKPVQICLNHHFNNILFVSVPSFDIDYIRFSLGNISIYKLLEWALENNYEMADLAYGKLEYKRRWSNHNYTFSHHIFAVDKNLKNRLGLFIEYNKIKLKNYLKTKNVDQLKDNLKKKLRKRNETNTPNIEIKPIDELDINGLKMIDIENRAYDSIRKCIYDYLYEEKNNINSVQVFEISPEQEYIIIGDQNRQQRILILRDNEHSK